MIRFVFFNFLLVTFSLIAAINPQVIIDESNQVFKENLSVYLEGQGSKLKAFSYRLSEDLASNAFLKDAHSYTLSSPSQRPKIGNQVQQLKLYDKLGNLINESYLNVNIRASIEMLIVNKHFKQNQIFSLNDINTQIRYLPKGDIKIEDCIFLKEDIKGKISQRQISRGEILRFYMLKERPLIMRGDAISLILNKDWGQVKVEGIALDDGYHGGNIGVKSILSRKKKMRGKVLDEKTVSIY